MRGETTDVEESLLQVLFTQEPVLSLGMESLKRHLSGGLPGHGKH